MHTKLKKLCKDTSFYGVVGIIACFPATLFMEYWKRYQNILAHRWNVQNLEPIDEPPRPEFIALIKKHGYKTTVNPVTNVSAHLPVDVL